MLIGRREISRGERHDGDHNRTINLKRYKELLTTNIADATIIKQSSLPVVKDNSIAITQIVSGRDI